MDIKWKILTIILAFAISIGGYYLNRYVNWSWGYEDMVERKIKEMVKREALNDNKP